MPAEADAVRDRLRAIGVELVAERRKKTPWKVLMAKYGYCRARLAQLYAAALETNEGVKS